MLEWGENPHLDEKERQRMVGFDGSEMDPMGDDPDDEITTIQLIAEVIQREMSARGMQVNILEGVTPGEVYLGVITEDDIGISIAINYTE